MAHDNHWFRCNYCGKIGKESELPVDPDGHECGKDTCPVCGVNGFIVCCFISEDDATDRELPEDFN